MQFILIDNLIFGFLVPMSICIKPYVTNYCIAIVLKLLVLIIAAPYSLKYVNCSEGEFVECQLILAAKFTVLPKTADALYRL